MQVELEPAGERGAEDKRAHDAGVVRLRQGLAAPFAHARHQLVDRERPRRSLGGFVEQGLQQLLVSALLLGLRRPGHLHPRAGAHQERGEPLHADLPVE